eukprot:1393743-Amorphochlora_amoeboformis.AAC.2
MASGCRLESGCCLKSGCRLESDGVWMASGWRLDGAWMGSEWRLDIAYARVYNPATMYVAKPKRLGLCVQPIILTGHVCFSEGHVQFKSR